MSHYVRVAWNPTEKVARAATWIDDHFGRGRYAVKFLGDHRYYAPNECEIPITYVLVPKPETLDDSESPTRI